MQPHEERVLMTYHHLFFFLPLNLKNKALLHCGAMSIYNTTLLSVGIYIFMFWHVSHIKCLSECHNKQTFNKHFDNTHTHTPVHTFVGTYTHTNTCICTYIHADRHTYRHTHCKLLQTGTAQLLTI